MTRVVMIGPSVKEYALFNSSGNELIRFLGDEISIHGDGFVGGYVVGDDDDRELMFVCNLAQGQSITEINHADPRSSSSPT